MPAASQNRLLQEKILLLNEKLSNVFEEIVEVKKFHKKVAHFFHELRDKIIDVNETQYTYPLDD